jgi:hypothetical protein
MNIDLEKQIEKTIQYCVSDAISKINIKDVVEHIVKKELDLRLDNFDFPKDSIDLSAIRLHKGAINGDNISDGMITKFSSTGIDDRATSCQLTILDDHVVVENQFTALNVTAAEDINAKNISLTGALEIGTEIIDHGALTQFVQLHANIVLEEELAKYQLQKKDEPGLINENSLAASISTSNLRRVGNLQELTVLGHSKFNETMFVGANSRVGINTETPRGALTICDQDSEITFVRSNKRTMFIGTTNSNNSLELGVDNQSSIAITQDLIDISTAIKVMGIKFSASTQIPEHVGEPNEIVFITNAREGQTLLYICKGGNKWISLAKA